MAYQFLWFDGFDFENDFKEVYIKGVEYAENGNKYTGSDVPYNYGKATDLDFSNGNFIYKILPGAPFTTLFIGFHWYWEYLDPSERTFLQFWDNANNLMQMEVRQLYDSFSGTFILRLYRGSTLVGTVNPGVIPYQWTWVSVKHHCDPTTGEFKIDLNGVNKLTYTGNTRNGAVSQVHRVKLTAGTNIWSGKFRVDNLVIATGASTDNPLPECRVYGAVVPTANDSIQFTPNAGSNWSNVDEIGPDYDTTYNYSNTVGHTDTFVGSPPSVNNAIYAVKANVSARKDDSGIRKVCPVIKPTTTVYEGDEVSVTPNYVTYGTIWENNPDTSLPWTPTQISNLKWGYRLKA